MAGKLNRFQTLTFNHWKGLTKENHLGSIAALQPKRVSDLMVELLAYKHGKSLNTFLSRFPVKEFEDDSEYFWDVIGSARRNIPLVEARDENNDPVTAEYEGNIGAGTAPFYLVFPEDWFADGSVIIFPTNYLPS